MVLGGAFEGSFTAAAGIAGGLTSSLEIGSQTLAKLEITPQKPSNLGKITVAFNPNSYSITKTVNWQNISNSTNEKEQTQRLLNAPQLKFGGGESRILTFDELFFDVTEPINGTQFQDVREKTNEIVALTKIEKGTAQPPICLLTWGNATPVNSDFPFTGVVTDLTQTFTLFKRDGRPVRAKLTVTFREYLDPIKDQKETDPELTTHIVKRGNTLSSIAAELYGDPTRWRVIAEANNLEDPRNLEIGKLLSIPDLS
jgi:hypothetical protein